MFEHEFQIRSGERLYWLPLQNALVEPFGDEVKAGDRLRRYIMHIGAVQVDRTFLINEFEVASRSA